MPIPIKYSIDSAYIYIFEVDGCIPEQQRNDERKTKQKPKY